MFFATLAVHIVAGLTCIVCGAVAALAVKGGPRHIRFARVYLWGLGVVWASMSILSAIRWQQNAPLFAVGSFSFAAALVGYLNRKRRPYLHIAGMGLSYTALLTGFYIDNGPHLPLWDQLPTWTYWTLPSLVGVPLIARAILRRLNRQASKLTDL
ncbi:hypothetical protein ACIBG8_08605 [Nonomuraea sp. NPDC050556]|uniref:hypothetical protein n=1 Tax=Nonomuraea sp. NPDC050556 TaxID=3364369 RepID=UPI0037A158FA